MSHRPPRFLSPAYPAAILLFGMLFGFVGTHFFLIPWSRWMTVVLYLVPLLWVSLLMWRGRHRMRPVSGVDVLFSGFVLVVVASILSNGELSPTLKRYWFYLPFMVVVPYLCGRLMRDCDVVLLSRISAYAGVALLPALVFDYLVSPDVRAGATRWTFFGKNHAALLIGALLSTTLLALSIPRTEARNAIRAGRLGTFALIATVMTFLVWVSARGWLIGAIAGLVALWFANAYKNDGSLGAPIRQLLVIVCVTSVALYLLPQSTGQFYASLLTKPDSVAISPQETGPILGDESCRSLSDGLNSVAVRWVLYREALAMFSQFPLTGVGAARFGERSCSILGFPHSTVLQALAELGLIGGSLLLGLFALAVFRLARRLKDAASKGRQDPAILFTLALFFTFFVADQIYGNYFMSVGIYLIVGVVAGMSPTYDEDHAPHV